MILLVNSSCIFWEPVPKSWRWGFKPRPLTGIKNFPSADTEYGKGFRDGCSSAWDVVAKGLLGDVKGRYDFKRRQKSSDYDSGWGDGLEQCTYIIDWDVS